MILTVYPTQHVRGRLKLPASKSYSIRAFLVAACGGRSEIINPSDCDDSRVALEAARHLGTTVKQQAPDRVLLQSPLARRKAGMINVGESGTVLRFLLPLLSLSTGKVTVTGKGTLVGRPNRHLTSVLRRHGVDIHGTGPNESVPIAIKGGKFSGGKITIAGTVSSQFISALLIACPQLREDTDIVITGRKLVSLDYIAMTCQVLKQSGIKIEKISDRLYRIAGGQHFSGLKIFRVPSDYGLAAFLLAAGILTDSSLILRGYFEKKLPQADARIMDFLRQMGARYKETSRSLSVSGPQVLVGGTFSLKDCPDLVPIMSVLALFASGKTQLCNIKHARVKESNRITDLRQELEKIGARITETADTLTIIPQKVYKGAVELDPRHDHRLAMAFSVLGLKIGAAVKDIECVSKSYPGFVNDFRGIGVRLKNSRE